MATFYILSPDELNQIEVVGNDINHAIENANSMAVLSFFEEYRLEDCHVEEIGGLKC